MRRQISAERVRELFDYNPEVGALFWRTAANGKQIGAPAGHVRVCSGRPYRYVSINGKNFPEHRLVLCHVNGQMPRNTVDHIDGNGLNNTLSNLRDVTPHENLKNSKLSKRSKSGVPGVRWCKRRGCWRVTIGVDGKRKEIGRSSDFEKAVAARRAAEAEYGYHPNHGRVEDPSNKKNFTHVTCLKFVPTTESVITPIAPRLDPTEAISWYELAIYPSRHCATAFGNILPLTNIEYRVLRCLVSAQGLEVPRLTLWEQVYGTPFDPASRTLDMNVSRLRDKLSATNMRLRALRETGYILEIKSRDLANAVIGRFNQTIFDFRCAALSEAVRSAA